MRNIKRLLATVTLIGVLGIPVEMVVFPAIAHADEPHEIIIVGG